jgi:hypothetical protein
MIDGRNSNLVSKQRRIQDLVDLFNEREQLWESLEAKRLLRRRLFRLLSPEVHKTLDLIDFIKACPPQDCVGCFKEPQETRRSFRDFLELANFGGSLRTLKIPKGLNWT